MVYCGKPSKGCQSCRKRKIRCDQIVPACTQCMRVGQECPGYRNLLDLSFRNESQSVIRKAKAKAGREPPKTGVASSLVVPTTVVEPSSIPQVSGGYGAAPGSQPLSFSSPLTDSSHLPLHEQHALIPTSSLSIYSMLPSAEDCGVNIFFANFVARRQGPSHGYFAYLPDFCRRGGMDTMLRRSMSAVGLAVQANVRKSSSMMTQARREYAMALQHINKALRSPIEAVKDTTLMSIIIMAFFASTVGARQLSLREWTEHINGAATLIQLRGPAQLRTPVGFGLFNQATTQLLISSLQREIPFPKQILEIGALARYPPSPGSRFMQLMGSITNLRSEINNPMAGGPKGLIPRALALDAQLAQIFADVPWDWRYEVVQTDEQSEVLFDGCYHIYYNHWISQLWNAMRAARIMLNELTRGLLLQGFTAAEPVFTVTEFTAQFEASTLMIAQMRDDILHSVPQHLGFVHRKPFLNMKMPAGPTASAPPLQMGFVPMPKGSSSAIPTPSSAPHHLSFPFVDLLPPPSQPSNPPRLQYDPSHPAASGYFLIFFISGIGRSSPPHIRAFAAQVLRFIGERMGLRQGSNLAAFMAHSEALFDDQMASEPPSIDRLRVLRDRVPIRPLKELLKRDEREREVVRGGLLGKGE